MTDQDPHYQETTRTIVAEPDPYRPGGAAQVRTTETTVQGRQSTTAWWIAGIVALAAIVGVVWMVVSTNETQQDALVAEGDAAAVEDAISDARLQGQLEGAQDGLAAAAAARASADRAAAEAAAARAEASRSDPPEVVIVQPAEPEPEPVNPTPAG